ncbi:tetratricopeptide repeat protein [Maribacter sp. 2308TA10-17]|uniref:tetratricopeptide repeat protein n=1 Tax=Maribacter sp. 2308TA10-17 TaxID=3386276 RepID=UPI0039BCA647
MKFKLLFKTILCSVAVFFLFTSDSTAQKTLTAEEWQEDLRFLQKTIHKDYPFLFKKVKADAFDAEIDKLHAAIPSMEVHEIKVGLTRMVSFFEYGHTQIPFSTLAEEAVLAVNLYHFEDGIFIEGVQKGNEKALGAKLIKIGETPIEEALKAIRPVVPAENDQYFKGYGLRFLTVPTVLHAQGVIPELRNEIALTLEKDGKVFQHTFGTIPLEKMSRGYGFTIPNEKWVSARDQTKTPLFLKHLYEKLYFFEYLEDSKTLYVRQSSVFNDEKETLADFYKRLFGFIDTNSVEKLVYDVRLNGGGNNYNNKPLIKGLMARPEINQRGKFFYIIGRNTFSACQNLTNEIGNYTEAIIVGEPTSENENFYGDAKKVTLPNSGINAYLSYAWWQDKSPWDGREWTLPHIAKEMTFEDYRTNQDVILDAAMNYTETGFILDPMQHLTDLFVAGKFDEVKRAGFQVANDPAYKYYDFQEEFGTAGYRLLTNGNPEGGIFILQLVADFYPESVGAWYNLAAAQEQLNQIDKAKESYKKIMELDPEGMTGRSAKNKLDNLNKQ